MLTTARLATYVGAAATDTQLATCITEATALIATLQPPEKTPEEIIERATLECAADLYHRRRARNGIITLESDGAIETIHAPLDPLRSARALLTPYLPVGIA